MPTAQAVKEGGYGVTACSFVAADAGEKMVDEAAKSTRELVGKPGGYGAVRAITLAGSSNRKSSPCLQLAAEEKTPQTSATPVGRKAI